MCLGLDVGSEEQLPTLTPPSRTLESLSSTRFDKDDSEGGGNAKPPGHQDVQIVRRAGWPRGVTLSSSMAHRDKRRKFESTTPLLSNARISIAGQEQWYSENIFQILGPAVAFQGNENYIQSWLQHLLGPLSLLKRPRFVDSAVRALALYNVGRNKSALRPLNPNLLETKVLHEGYYHYNQALQTIRSGIEETTRDKSSLDTLAAAMLLAFYEMFAWTNSAAWYTHAQGAGALIRLRGPTRTLHTPGSRSMFMSFRPAITVSALLNELPCFLAEDEWRRVAVTIHEGLPDRDVLMDTSEALYDEFAQLPSLVIKVQTAVQRFQSVTPEFAANHALQVLAELLRHRWHLQDIFEKFMRELDATGQQPYLRSISSAFYRSTTAPALLPFARPLIGSSLCFLWTCQILLNSRLASLHSAIGAAYGTDPVGNFTALSQGQGAPEMAARSRASVAELKAENMILALSIFNSIKSNPRTETPDHLSFALKVAYYALADSPTTRQRIWEQLEDIGRSFGAANVIDSPQERTLARLSRID